MGGEVWEEVRREVWGSLEEVGRGIKVSPNTSHLSSPPPTFQHTFPHLSLPPYTFPHLPHLPHTSLHLSSPPHTSPHLPHTSLIVWQKFWQPLLLIYRKIFVLIPISLSLAVSLYITWLSKMLQRFCSKKQTAAYLATRVRYPEMTAQMAEWYTASVSWAVYSGLIPSRVKPMTLNWYSQLPCLTLSIKGTVWRTSRQVYLLCRWERHLAGFPHLGEVDSWLATPKRARIAHWSLSRERRMNMHLNKKKNERLCLIQR